MTLSRHTHAQLKISYLLIFETVGVVCMDTCKGSINHEVSDLIEIGNGLGGTRVGSTDRETVKRNVSRVFAAAKANLVKANA